jgi:hypothetical protein
MWDDANLDATAADEVRPAGHLLILPSWLLSLAFHLLAAIMLALLIGGTSPPSDIAEADRKASVVLVQRTGRQTQYFAEEQWHDALQPAAPVVATAASASGGSADAALPAADAAPLLPGTGLPKLPGALSSGEGLVAHPQPGAGRGRPIVLPGLDDAAILAEDALIPREQVPTGPTAQMSLFGAAAEGRSFVFVIDRSQSMGGDGLGAIQAAAKELAGQIDQLSPEQTFQVVAYNQGIAYLSGRELIAATDENKRKLIEFVKNLAAFGQTEHSRGLAAALRLKPEVIYLLTDAGDPHLDNGQMRIVREQAAGRTTVHALHFGRGPLESSEHFLARLAAENRGSYRYIDMDAR